MQSVSRRGITSMMQCGTRVIFAHDPLHLPPKVYAGNAARLHRQCATPGLLSDHVMRDAAADENRPLSPDMSTLSDGSCLAHDGDGVARLREMPMHHRTPVPAASRTTPLKHC